jgi:ATP-dependent DNA helicase RecG
VSPEAVELAAGMVRLLRTEYKDGCRDRRAIDVMMERWKDRVDQLEPAESRRLLAAVRPLLRGYSCLAMGERQHCIVTSGQELARLSGQEKAHVAGTAVAPPPAGKPTLQLDSQIQFLKGVGPGLATRLNTLGIYTIGGLLLHYPRRWEDRTTFRPISSLRPGAVETVKGILGPARTKNPKPKMTLTQIALSDATGTVQLTWFNQPHLAKTLLPGHEAIAAGKVEENFGELQMSSPELETGEDLIQAGRIVPVYPLTGGVTQKWMRRTQFSCVPTYAPLVPDPVPYRIQVTHSLLPKAQAVVQLHWPSGFEQRELARQRLAFEELLLLQMELARQRQLREREERALNFALHQPLLADFLQLLPFAPTGAQRRVFDEILSDLARDTPMNRLLQGDVGAGKTAVAAFACWCAIRSGYQAAIMAPTEILAQQHAHKLNELLEPAGIVTTLLTGSLKKSQKVQRYAAIKDNQIQLVVGTHALIQEGLEFASLGLVVVDEQHKFGVMQRTTLRQKGRNPDLLVMTATPIPRTLALTLYGDLEVSRLDELPPGRQPIHSESVPFSERKRVYDDIRAQVRQGRQVYIVCPLIDETDKLEATAVKEEAEILRTRVFPEFKLGLLHGKLKSAEKEQIMNAFRAGEYEILISTTVIEVGVDVPNATVMLIQDANRFGLAQLHQLRGRVGRGKHASRCIFMGDAKSANTARRLKAIARLSDGFDVAEEDLEIRGPGDFYGKRQSGFPELRVADLLRDQQWLDLARKEAQQILDSDPELELPEHEVMKRILDARVLGAAELVH